MTKDDLHNLAANVKAGFTKPTTWVLVFGWFLAACAGSVNTIVYLRWNAFVAHMTGNTTKLGMNLQGWHFQTVEGAAVQESAMVVICFVAGAFLCGVLIDKNKVHFGGKSFYGLALVLNSTLLVLASWHDGYYSAYLATMACGLQNAMCTSHFGAIVRTTHVTGTLTDIGSTLGRIVMIFIRKGFRRSRLDILDHAEIEVDYMKLTVLLPLFLCFLLGCTAGAYLHEVVGEHGLLVPAGVTGFIGLVYCFCRQMMKERIKRFERERLQRDLSKVHLSLSRAGGLLRGIHGVHSAGKAADYPEAGDDADLEELCSEVSNMREAIIDVESNLDVLYQQRNTVAPTAGNTQRHSFTTATMPAQAFASEYFRNPLTRSSSSHF